MLQMYEPPVRGTADREWMMEMMKRAFPGWLLSVLIVASCIAAGAAEARSIRVDPGFDTTGDASWEQNFGNVLDDSGDTGQVTLPFNFFGASTLFVSNRGVASFGAPITVQADLVTASTPYLAPLFLTNNDGNLAMTFDWGGQTRDCSSPPGDCGPDGEVGIPPPPLLDLVPIDTGRTAFADAAFRITWKITDEFDTITATQMAVWLLRDGNYVVEFNYDLIGFDPATSFAGFDLGGGNSFDASSVSDYINLSACNDPADGCTAGDNYVAPGFPAGALRDAFLAPIFGTPVSGRAIFFIPGTGGGGGGVPVPEPGSFALLLGGLAVLTALRRRGGVARLPA
jgi:hypothetical protein